MPFDFTHTLTIEDGTVRGRNTDGSESLPLFIADEWLGGREEGRALAELLAASFNSLIESRNVGREIAERTAREHGKHV